MIELPDDDPAEEYTLEERRTLTEQLEAITTRLHRGEFRAQPLDMRLLRELHASVFDGVRSHAGRCRTHGYGSEHLTFGPHRSSHRNDVERQLEAMFREVDRELRALRDDDPDDYELRAVTLAVRAHAEIIRIHPFQDGNGRTSRLCAGHLLVQLGLRPVAIEAVKQEYTEALNHYYLARTIEPLVDLYLRLYSANH